MHLHRVHRIQSLQSFYLAFTPSLPPPLSLSLSPSPSSLSTPQLRTFSSSLSCRDSPRSSAFASTSTPASSHLLPSHRLNQSQKHDRNYYPNSAVRQNIPRNPHRWYSTTVTSRRRQFATYTTTTTTTPPQPPLPEESLRGNQVHQTPESRQQQQQQQQHQQKPHPTPLSPEQYHALSDAYIETLVNRLEELQEQREEFDCEYSVRFVPPLPLSPVPLIAKSQLSATGRRLNHLLPPRGHLRFKQTASQ